MAIKPAAIGIILSEDNSQVLLVKRIDVPIWVLPGGGIDAQEKAESAVVREILEETGFNVKIKKICAEYIPINKLGAVTSIFLCEIQGGRPVLSDETSEIKFFPIADLPKLFFPPHKKWLEEALKGPRQIRLRRPMVGVTYLNLIKFFLAHPFLTLKYLWKR